MKITTPELRVVLFAADDVLATSQYFIQVGDSYRYIGGEMTYYDPDAQGWAVNETVNFGYAGADSVEYFKSEGQWYPDMYDAYMYNDGIYTKGVSYYDIYMSNQ